MQSTRAADILKWARPQITDKYLWKQLKEAIRLGHELNTEPVIPGPVDWAFIEGELSSVGNPFQVMQFVGDVLNLLRKQRDVNSIPVLENLEYVMQQLVKHIQYLVHKERERQHP